MDEPALQASLDRLADADLLFVEGAPPQAKYRFKHALIQDAAYDSLLKSRRQALHRRAAEVLRDDRARSAEPEVDRPSFHRRPASTISRSNGGARRATRRCAARRSRRRSPISARRSRWRTRRRARFATAAGDAAARSQRLKLQTDYGQAMMWSKGFAAEETKAAFARAADWPGGPTTFQSVSRRCKASGQRRAQEGELGFVREQALTFLREAEDAGRVKKLASPIVWLGLIAYWRGDFVEARTHYERATQRSRPERRPEGSG